MVYEYVCGFCGIETEIEHSIKDPPYTTCPECGQSTLRRMISGAPKVILKGSGWASDGYSSSQKSVESTSE